jgi:hypothetical protein
MTNKRAGMPTEKRIREYWAPHYEIFGHYDSPEEVLEDGVCMACGAYRESRKGGAAKMDRAHIQALSDGGGNGADNLHLLCSTCHRDSEYLTGDKYYKWLRERNQFDPLYSIGLRYHGFNPSTLYQYADEKANQDKQGAQDVAAVRVDDRARRSHASTKRARASRDIGSTSNVRRGNDLGSNCPRTQGQRAYEPEQQTQIDFGAAAR